MAFMSTLCVSVNVDRRSSFPGNHPEHPEDAPPKHAGKMGRADDIKQFDKVVIDVGGDRFVTSRSTLLNVPQTLLYNLVSDSTPANERPEFFFDRNPFLFRYILDFYRTGELHLPQNRCGRAIQSELEFWGLDEGCVATCCWKTFTDATQAVTTQRRIAREFSALSNCCKSSLVKDNSTRNRLWNFFSNPESSTAARVYFGVSCFLVLLSLAIIMLSTMPDVRHTILLHLRNASLGNHTESNPPNRRVLHMLRTTTPHASILYVDLAIAILLTIEFSVKLWVCPDKCGFLKSFSTFTDVIHFLPVLSLHFVHRLNTSIWLRVQDSEFVIFFQSLFALRVLRMSRLACCVRGFKVLVLAMKASLKELLLLIMLVMFTAVFFAFLIFYVEVETQDSFSNALMGMWWAVITMTSVGYGDLYPTSALGYVIGVLCAFAGIVLISLPVPMVANNFNLYYAYKDEPVDAASKLRWFGKNNESLSKLDMTDSVSKGKDNVKRDEENDSNQNEIPT